MKARELEELEHYVEKRMEEWEAFMLLRKLDEVTKKVDLQLERRQQQHSS